MIRSPIIMRGIFECPTEGGNQRERSEASALRGGRTLEYAQYDLHFVQVAHIQVAANNSELRQS